MGQNQTNRLVIILLLLLIFSGCRKTELIIIGNVEKPVLFDKHGNLEEIFSEFSIVAENALLISHDGLAVYLPKNAFKHLYLYKKNDKWFSQSDILPTVCNIRNLQEICIFQPFTGFSVEQIKKNHCKILSPFSAYLEQFEYAGSSTKNNISVKKYKFKNDFIYKTIADSCEIEFLNGEKKNFSLSVYPKIYLAQNCFKIDENTLKTIRLK